MIVVAFKKVRRVRRIGLSSGLYSTLMLRASDAEAIGFREYFYRILV